MKWYLNMGILGSGDDYDCDGELRRAKEGEEGPAVAVMTCEPDCDDRDDQECELVTGQHGASGTPEEAVKRLDGFLGEHNMEAHFDNNL